MSDFGVCLVADLAPAPATHRKRLEPEMTSAFEEANEHFSGGLRIPFHGIGGGVWTGALGVLGTALDAAFYINHAMFPARTCIGLGAGALGSGELRESPCFARARRGLETARGIGGGTTLDSGDSLLDLGANTMLLLLHTLLESWTPKQLEAYQAFQREGTENRAAQSLGISQSALHQRLSASRAKTYEQARTRMLEFVARCARS